MTHDIFISYSRKDVAKALAFVEQLTAEGFSVWIDQRGIEASASWSKEIVDAIDRCKVFAVLLSSSSLSSANVIREISLALESGCSLLPIDLEDVTLPNDVRYQLAGIQRVPIAQFDRILSGLSRVGVLATSGEQRPTLPSPKKDNRMSLLVLPFQDLSPAQDNLWFADGLAGELVDSLSQIKALRLIDRKTSGTLRTSPLPLFEIAKTLDVRYVIEGSVRKFNDQLKISVTLLDVLEGEHLWQYSHKGLMDDIFEIQEQVAERVVEGLKLQLTRTEAARITQKGTDSVEAYVLFMRAGEQAFGQTRSSIKIASELLRESLRHDPHFSAAASMLVTLLITEYSHYAERPALMEEAQQILSDLLKHDPLSEYTLNAYSTLLYILGDAEKAIEVGLLQVKQRPSAVGYVTLAQAYALARRFEEANSMYVKAWQLNDSNLGLYWSAMTDASTAGDLSRRSEWARLGLPSFERHLKLNPADETTRIQYISILEAIGRKDEAREALERLSTPKDAVSAYNLACLATYVGEYHRAIELLRSSLSQENNLSETLATDPDLDPLRELPEFKAMLSDTMTVHSSSGKD